MTNNKGLLIILSAPSGCGKDTVFKAIKDLRNDVVESISATTRKPREGEVEGVNYYFKSESDFQLMVVNDELLEYARYNNCYYGTPVSEVEKAINDGKICFLIIDVQGAQSILKVRPDAISIFLLPPREIDMAPLYKYTVVNDDLNECVNKINDIINKELLTLNSKEIK